MRRMMKEGGIYLVLVAIIAGGIYLVRANRTLIDQNRQLARRAVEPRPGLFVAAEPVRTLDGDSVVLGARGHRQLVFFFNHTCPYCRTSIPAWNTLAADLATEPGLEIYGVAFDSAEVAAAYAAEQQLAFPVIASPGLRLIGLYRVSNVPLILVLNADGRMAYARLGVLDTPDALDSVRTAAKTAARVLTATVP